MDCIVNGITDLDRTERLSYPLVLKKQSRFDARYWMLGASALGRPRGMVRGGRREEGLGWGARVHPWRIYVNV